MEFWGVEVKPGQQLECSPGEDKYIHLSQVAIGEGSKSDDRVAVYIHVDGKKIMIGSCVRESCEQFGLDLVFEKDFKISHTSKSASVFCCGYTTFIQEDDEFGSLHGDDEDDESESEDEVPPPVVTAKENGEKSNKPATKGKLEKPKQPAKVEEEDDSDDESDDDEDEDMKDISDDDDDEEEDEDEDSDDDEDEEDESDEETPKAPTGKKRPIPDSAAKTPVSDKKAKFATPDGHKPDDKKQKAHVATPHPGAKKGDKKGKETPGGAKQETPASKETPKSNASTPASGKKFSCQPCQRSFNSETALNSHNSAKHGKS